MQQYESYARKMAPKRLAGYALYLIVKIKESYYLRRTTQYSIGLHSMSFHKHGAMFCTNCGTSGHAYRQCTEPVSSYGVLVFRYVSRTSEWPQNTEFCKDSRCSTGLGSVVPQVLLIQRKDTLGYMDIMRGRYKLTDLDYISRQLKGITHKEHDALLHGDFDTMWSALWNSDTDSMNKYSHNKLQSSQKLEALRKGVPNGSSGTVTLEDLLRQDPVLYDSPEWGFPKGRRDNRESDSVCAFRELGEETGIHESELIRVTNIEPFIEQFYGSNDIHYRHTYFLALYAGQREIGFDQLNSEMTREISNMTWKNIDEALLLLRPENLEKRGMLIQLATLLRNYSPILREPLVGENKGEEQQDKYVFQRRGRGDARGRTFGGGSSE